MMEVLQAFIDQRTPERGQRIKICEKDAEEMLAAEGNDRQMGALLKKFLGVVTGESCEILPAREDKLVREFRGYRIFKRSQGSYVLGSLGSKGPPSSGGVTKLGSSSSEADHGSAQPTPEQRKLLAQLGLQQKPVPGDGNCQFHAIGAAVEEEAQTVRRSAVEFMEKHADNFKGFSEKPWKDYLAEMSKDGTWGDECTLRALATHYKRYIYIISDEPTNPEKIIPPQTVEGENLGEPIVLLFYAEWHYDAVKPAGRSSWAAFTVSCFLLGDQLACCAMKMSDSCISVFAKRKKFHTKSIWFLTSCSFCGQWYL